MAFVSAAKPSLRMSRSRATGFCDIVWLAQCHQRNESSNEFTYRHRLSFLAISILDLTEAFGLSFGAVCGGRVAGRLRTADSSGVMQSLVALWLKAFSQH